MKHIIAAVLLIILIPVLIIRLTPTIRAVVYDAIISREIRSAVAQTASWHRIDSQHVEVRYETDHEIAALVLEAAEYQFRRVIEDFEFEPTEKVTVLIYQTREALRSEFGWSSADDASGVYWGGVVRVLSPRAYSEHHSLGVISEEFHRTGPLAHEFTHYVLDRITRGNYPRWLSEGLAQYQEYSILGYLWAQPGPLEANDYHPYENLDKKFDGMGDQAIAYHQALSMTNYLISLKGWPGMGRLISQLAEGQGFGSALYSVYGLDVASLESQWLENVETTGGEQHFQSRGTRGKFAE